MTPLQLDEVDRAKLYLAICDALDVPRRPESQVDRARSQYALAISERGGDPAELFATYAVADDICAETAGHGYTVKSAVVAEAYAIDVGRARSALRLAGWVRTGRGDWWSNEAGATTEWRPEATDLLREQFD